MELFSSKSSTMPEVLGTSKSIYGFDPRIVPGCVLWLDGADSRTLSFSSGSNISSWADKSGNANNANIVTATPPTYSSVTNSVVFAAASAMGLRGNMSSSVTNASVFIVASYTSNAVSPALPRLFGLGSNNSTENFLIGQFNLINQPMSIVVSYVGNLSGNAFGDANYQTGGNITYATRFLYTNISTYSGSTFTNFTLVNGAAGTFANKTGTQASGGFYLGSANRYAIGNSIFSTPTANGDSYNGNVFEILVYSNAITDAQRQAVEGYLAWKWGLNANLPTTHAFPLIKPHSRQFILNDSLTPWIWFDAADRSTISVSPGTSNITAWSNKGLAGGSALSSSGSGTLTTGSVRPNGLNFINIPAFARLGFTIGIPNQPRAWFAVFKQTSQVTLSGTGGNLQYFSIFNQTTGNGQDSLFGPGVPTGSTSSNTYNVGLGPSGFIGGVSTATAPNGYDLFKQYVWVNSGTASSNAITIDGVAQTLSLSSNAGSFQTASVLYVIGDRDYGNSAQIAELILFNSEITVGQRQSVEGYLARKWGLAALPITHPYYVFNPLSAIPFSPTNIPSCVVWLDGDDPAGTGVRPASGATVSSWKDKSGQSNHFTGSFVTAGTAPVWTPRLFNGCGGITMSGSSDAAQGSYFQLPTASLPINVGTTCTFFIVCYVIGSGASPSTAASRLLATSYAGNASDFNDTGTFLVQWYTTSIELYRLLTNRVIISSASGDTILLLSVVFDGTNMNFYRSGVLSGTGTPGSATGFAPSTGNFKFTTIAIGRLLGTTSGNYSFNGYALEYIIYNQALTTAQRQQVEGYLSAKWGTTLSVSHPHYNYFPAQQGFTDVTPSTITAVTLSSLSATGGTLSWTASTNAAEYFWYIGTASGSGTILASGKVVSGTLTVNFSASLTASVTYYGWVIPRSSTLTNGATTIGSGSWSSISYATGGTITTTGTPQRRFHTFTTNGNFVLTTYPPTAPIEVMCIGGGGGGGVQAGGGGGAGNMIAATFTSGTGPAQLSPGTYAVVIGTGGGGGRIGVSRGSNGTNTTFASTKVVALGGGGGGTWSIAQGANGGCGGGGSQLAQRFPGSASNGTTTGTSLFNTSFGGGTGFNDGSQGGAGGGGTSAVGASQPTAASAGRPGGAGTLYRGSYYGGGGGGSQGGTYFGAPFNGGAGGIGGGGRGTSYTNSTFSEPGTPNTGGGGGASAGVPGPDEFGARGGDGVCIISYAFP